MTKELGAKGSGTGEWKSGQLGDMLGRTERQIGQCGGGIDSYECCDPNGVEKAGCVHDEEETAHSC